jgi:hypothetical protein
MIQSYITSIWLKHNQIVTIRSNIHSKSLSLYFTTTRNKHFLLVLLAQSNVIHVTPWHGWLQEQQQVHYKELSFDDLGPFWPDSSGRRAPLVKHLTFKIKMMASTRAFYWAHCWVLYLQVQELAFDGPMVSLVLSSAMLKCNSLIWIWVWPCIFLVHPLLVESWAS